MTAIPFCSMRLGGLDAKVAEVSEQTGSVSRIVLELSGIRLSLDSAELQQLQYVLDQAQKRLRLRQEQTFLAGNLTLDL